MSGLPVLNPSESSCLPSAKEYCKGHAHFLTTILRACPDRDKRHWQPSVRRDMHATKKVVYSPDETPEYSPEARMDVHSNTADTAFRTVPSTDPGANVHRSTSEHQTPSHDAHSHAEFEVSTPIPAKMTSLISHSQNCRRQTMKKAQILMRCSPSSWVTSSRHTTGAMPTTQRRSQATLHSAWLFIIA